MRWGPFLVGIFFALVALGLFKDGEGGGGLVCALIAAAAFSASKKQWKYKGSAHLWQKE